MDQIDIERHVMVRWGWDDSGGVDGHMIVLVGYNTSGSALTFINPLNSSYQTKSYSWVESDGEHTWSHTRDGIYN